MKKVHETVIQDLETSKRRLSGEMQAHINRIGELRKLRDEAAIAICEIDDLIALIKGDTENV
jgi:hypothetical protein